MEHLEQLCPTRVRSSRRFCAAQLGCSL